jgi:hypothetical protein
MAFIIRLLAGAAIATWMSGCCGGPPAHKCSFVEVSDAAMDASPDVSVPCGFEICQPGKTTCCFQEMAFMCIPIGAPCKGQSSMCSGDDDCGGAHCCAIVQEMQISCQPFCPGATTDGTVRVCRTSSECPPAWPYCSQSIINRQPVRACGPPPMSGL